MVESREGTSVVRTGGVCKILGGWCLSVDSCYEPLSFTSLRYLPYYDAKATRLRIGSRKRNGIERTRNDAKTLIGAMDWKTIAEVQNS